RCVDLAAATAEKTAERLAQPHLDVFNRSVVVKHLALYVSSSRRRLHLLDAGDGLFCGISIAGSAILFCASVESESRAQTDQSNHEPFEHRKNAPFVLVLAADCITMKTITTLSL